MNNSESIEMYLETIYLLEDSHGHAHGVDVAKRLGVSRASVSKEMKQLKDKGLVNQEKYGTITLTNKGREISKKVYCKHKIISLFLRDSLGLSNKESDENACRIEHVLSDKMVESIKEYLNKNNIIY